jgi:putative transcriptional regulator
MNAATKKRYLGHLLAASPSNPKDSFSQSVLLLTTHDDMAVALQINYPYTVIKLDTVVQSMGIDWETDDELWFGGVYAPSRVHVVHTTDWMGYNTVKLNDDLAVTNDVSVLAALSEGEGPSLYRACTGYYMWDAKELDLQLAKPSEIKKKPKYRWELAPSSLDLVFNSRGVEQWRQTLIESMRYQVDEYF